MWLTTTRPAGSTGSPTTTAAPGASTPPALPLSHDSGAGTMVTFLHDDRGPAGPARARTRPPPRPWTGAGRPRSPRAVASDGRTIAYALRRRRHRPHRRHRPTRHPHLPLERRRPDRNRRSTPTAWSRCTTPTTTRRRVTTQRSPHGRVSRYTYLPGNVTEVADPDGTRANTWIADGRGRLIGIIDSTGNRQSTSYDKHGNPVLVTGRDGDATVRAVQRPRPCWSARSARPAPISSSRTTTRTGSSRWSTEARCGDDVTPMTAPPQPLDDDRSRRRRHPARAGSDGLLTQADRPDRRRAAVHLRRARRPDRHHQRAGDTARLEHDAVRAGRRGDHARRSPYHLPLRPDTGSLSEHRSRRCDLDLRAHRGGSSRRDHRPHRRAHRDRVRRPRRRDRHHRPARPGDHPHAWTTSATSPPSSSPTAAPGGSPTTRCPG